MSLFFFLERSAAEKSMPVVLHATLHAGKDTLYFKRSHKMSQESIPIVGVGCLCFCNKRTSNMIYTLLL